MPRGKKTVAVESSKMTAEVLKTLTVWYQKSVELTKLKEEEFALRNEIVCNAGFDIQKLEGTETLDLNSFWPGWKLKAVKDQNRTLTNDNGESVALQYALHPLRPDFAQNIVKWKPDLSITTYRELLSFLDTANQDDPQIMAIREALAKALTCKPGAPTLTLVPPKAAEEVAT